MSHSPFAPALRPVLLIDDSHEDLFLVKRRLTSAGVRLPIVSVDDGEQAMSLLTAAMLPGAAGLVPSAIICDIRMPRIDGLELLKWVRNQPLLNRTLFVVLTGGDLPEDRARAKQLGADHFLTKFPDAEVFRRVLAGLA